MKLDDIIEKIC